MARLIDLLDCTFPVQIDGTLLSPVDYVSRVHNDGTFPVHVDETGWVGIEEI